MSIEELTQDPKIWEVARYFAIAMGEVPNSFSATIRTLMGDHQKDPEQYSRGGGFLATRLLKSPSLAVPLLFASKTFHPDKVRSETVTPAELLSMYRPLELAALFGTMYAFRKARRRAPADSWAPLAKVLMDASDLGGLVGLAIPKIGFAHGLLAGAFTYISITPFILQNPKAYKEYRRKLGSKGPRYDMKAEIETLGCTHAHVASFILPSLGFGVDLAQSVTEGMMAELGAAPPVESPAYKSYIAMMWINSLLKSGEVPDITHKGGFYPLKADLDNLLSAANAIKNSGSTYAWLDKGKVDEPSGAATSGDEAEIPAEEIPEELQKEIDNS
ncbi:MAG: hypothetical protein J0M12_15525 [Deltaproteobacteria bacterium]|nr:hypothetical protein [Deltaproteobacteria bacterium]